MGVLLHGQWRDGGSTMALSLDDLHGKPVNGLNGDAVDVSQPALHFLGGRVRKRDHGDLVWSSCSLAHHMTDLFDDDPRLARTSPGRYEYTVVEIDDGVTLGLV